MINQIEAKRKQMQCYSYIAGLVILIVLGGIAGENGIAYMAAMLVSLAFFMILTAGGTADAVGRLLRSKRSKGQFRDARKLRKCSVMVQLVSGAAGTVLFLLLSGVLAEKVFRMPYAVIPMRILAPVVLIGALQATLLGYFQGSGFQMPSVTVSWLRQILYISFGLLFGRVLHGYGGKVSAFLKNVDFTGMYVVIGIAVGILVSELLLLLFLTVVYLGSNRKTDSEKSREGLQKTEGFVSSVRLIFLLRSFPCAVLLLCLLAVGLGMVVYQRNAEGAADSAYAYGRYVMGYLAVCGIPCFLMLGRLIPVYGRMTFMSRKKEHRNIRELGQAAIHYSWIVSLYAALLLEVMAPELAGFLFSESAQEVSAMLRSGGVLVLFVGMASSVLIYQLGSDQRYVVLCELLGGNVVFFISLFLMSGGDAAGIMTLIYAGLIGTGCVFLAGVVMLLLGGHLAVDYLRVLVVPLIAAGAAGLCMLFLGRLLSPHMGNLVSFVICAVVGIVLDMLILALSRNVSGQ